MLAHSDLTGSGSAEELRNDTDCLVASYLGETPAVAVGRSRKAVQESFRSIHGLVRECDTPRMTNAHPVRVQLTGDREGSYVVAEERADGSLVLTPDGRRRGRVPADSSGLLAQLFRRPSHETLTPSEALSAWGVDLLEDESVDEFAVADVDGQHGFVAVTNHRFIFLARTRTSLAPQQEYSLNQLASVEPLGRRGKAGLIVGWKQAAPIMIEGHDRAQLKQLKASLLAHATKPDGLQDPRGR